MLVAGVTAAALLGLDMVAARSATKRVPVDGPPGKRGKPPTKVVRDTEGTVPFDTVARFPYAARVRMGQADHYLGRDLPFAHALD